MQYRQGVYHFVNIPFATNHSYHFYPLNHSSDIKNDNKRQQITMTRQTRLSMQTIAAQTLRLHNDATLPHVAFKTVTKTATIVTNRYE